MDISKLAEKLENAFDGGAARKLAQLEPHSAHAAFRHMERYSATFRHPEEMARLRGSGFGRSALEEAIAREARTYREASSAFRLFEEARAWHSSGQMSGAARALGLPEALAGYDRVMGFAGQADALMKTMATSSATTEALRKMSAVDTMASALANAVSPYSAERAALVSWERQLNARIKSLSHPWMLPDNPARSVLGFGHLARVSDALRLSVPYSRDLNSFLREELGDAGATNDEGTPEEQDAAAIDAGMRPELIAFPRASYPIVIGAAGLTLNLPPLPIPQPVEGVNPGAGFDPVVSEILCQVETRLRMFVELRLTRAAGVEWMKTRVGREMRAAWCERQNKERAKGNPVYAEIYYADLMDLQALICRSDNWGEFADVFSSKIHITRSLEQIAPIRNDEAHRRPVGMAQRLRLVAEAAQILKALGVSIFH